MIVYGKETFEILIELPGQMKSEGRAFLLAKQSHAPLILSDKRTSQPAVPLEKCRGGAAAAALQDKERRVIRRQRWRLSVSSLGA